MPPTSCTPEVRGTSARLTSPHAPNLVHAGGSGHQRAADEPPCPQPRARTDRNGSVGTGHSACPRRALGLGRPAQRGSGAGLVGEAGEIVWLVDVLEGAGCPVDRPPQDRKSTRLNSSH